MAGGLIPFSYTSIYAVAIALLTGTIVASAIWVRKRGEWTRRGFVWHYVPMSLLWSFICLSIVSAQISTDDSAHSGVYGYSTGTLNLVLVMKVVRQHTDLFYLTALVMLLSGFKTSLSFGDTNVTFRLIHFSILLLLGLFSWIGLVMGELIVADVTARIYPADSTKSYHTIIATWDVLGFITSLNLLACGGVVLHRAVKARHFGFLYLKAVYLFAALFINVLRATCLLVVAARTFSSHPGASLASQSLEIMFYTWLSVLLSAVLVSIGASRTWLMSNLNITTSLHSRDRDTFSQIPDTENCYRLEHPSPFSAVKLGSTATTKPSITA